MLPGLTIIIASLVLGFRGKLSMRIKRSMIAMLIVVAVSMLAYAQYYNPGLAARYSWGFDFMYLFVTPFCAPLYYLFVNCLTDIKRRPAVNVLVFVPTIIYAVMLLTAQMLMDGAERHAYICNEIMGQDIQMESTVAYNFMVAIGKKVFSIFMPAQGILVMVYGEFRLNTYLTLLNNYASTHQSDKKIKIRGIHVLTILIILTGLIMSSIPVYESTDHIPLVAIAVVGQMILVSLIVHNVMQLEFTAEDINKDLNGEPEAPVRPVVQPVRPVAVNTPGKPAAKAVEPVPDTLIGRIEHAMRNDNLFLQPELSLVSLCEQVGTNRTYASKAIKDATGCNFSDYVNRFRLEYALEMMKQLPKDQIVIQNIAVQCGCGSIQTFYRYFKLFYNETPTQWLERNK
jgi:AraC-like DNA-binding protein